MYVLAIIGFFLRAFDFAGSVGAYVATPLAYPTYVRGTAHGFHFAMGRLGGLAATIPVPGANGGFFPKLVLYTIANALCATVAIIFAPVFNKSAEFEKLKEDKAAANVEKREGSIIRSQASRSFVTESGTSEMRARR